MLFSKALFLKHSLKQSHIYIYIYIFKRKLVTPKANYILFIQLLQQLKEILAYFRNSESTKISKGFA